MNDIFSALCNKELIYPSHRFHHSYQIKVKKREDLQLDNILHKIQVAIYLCCKNHVKLRFPPRLNKDDQSKLVLHQQQCQSDWESLLLLRLNVTN